MLLIIECRSHKQCTSYCIYVRSRPVLCFTATVYFPYQNLSLIIKVEPTIVSMINLYTIRFYLSGSVCASGSGTLQIILILLLTLHNGFLTD